MANLLSKAYNAIVSKASRGTLSSYVVNAPHEYGQPNIVAGDSSGLITPQRMREIVKRTPTVAASMNAILDYTTNVDILVRNIDPSLPADKHKKKLIDQFLENPNDFDTKRQFMSKIIWDLGILGFAAIEIEPNRFGKPAKLHVLDAARIGIDYDEHGKVLGYTMLDAHGIPIRGTDGVHAWTPDEVIFLRRDAVSDSLYPLSRIHQLFTCAVLEDMMVNFISGKFTESNVPYGIFDLGDVSEQELKMAVTHWNEQATSNHRILLTGSRGGSTFTHFGYALKDLEAVTLLQEVRAKIMSILGVTTNELGQSQDVNKSNGYNLSYTFKRRAIEPILNEIIQTFTARFVHNSLGFDDIELYFEEIDSRDELLQSQIDEINLKWGVYTPNHVRNRKGLTSVAGGDEPYVVLGTNAVPMSMLRDFAEAQLAAIQAEVTALNAGAQSGITPPAVRGPQSPIKQNTPDGAGSSQVRISYPKPESQQKPRGAVQANRNAGLRKEEMTS